MNLLREAARAEAAAALARDPTLWAVLPPRAQDVLQRRLTGSATFAQIATHWGCSRARIAQLEAQSVRRVLGHARRRRPGGD